jgi:RNA polymerase sigma-70 factor (ECF subfamily)
MTAVDELLRRAKNGDQKALDAFLEMHLPVVFRFVSMRLGRDHADVDDVVQETLIAAAGSIHGLRAEREGAVPAWFLSIARHKVADNLRRRPHQVDVSAVAEGLDVQEIVSDRDRDLRLRAAMAELTSEQEEVLVLRFVLGYDGEQTAGITGRTLGAVKALQRRALASLQKLLQREGMEWR